MNNRKRTLVKYLPRSGSRMVYPSRFVVTFDECGTVDTIEQDGKLLPANNRFVKAIVKGIDGVWAGTIAPVGFTWGCN